MRTRRISQLTETTSNIHIDDQVTLVNSSPLNNYRVSINSLSEVFSTSLWMRNELDGGFAGSIPVQNVNADVGAGDLTGESLADGDWGATDYNFLVRADGGKDRAMSYGIMDSNAVTWGDNGEPEWWKVEGPAGKDIEDMRNEIGANTTWSGGATTAGEKQREAIRRLMAAPNTYNRTTTTWSTASYVRSQNQAITANPYTFCMFWGQPKNSLWEDSDHLRNYEMLWSAGDRNFTHNAGAGWRLGKFNESLWFHVGQGAVNENDYPGSFGFLDIAYGRSANTVTRTGGDNAYVYQIPHSDAGGTSTTINQLMDPVNVPGDIYMYYHITVVYNGGPIGYHDMTDFSASAQDTMATNIRNSFKFYQTNLRNGYVTEIPWVMCRFHRLFGDATNNVASNVPVGNTESANSFGFFTGIGDNRHNTLDNTKWSIMADLENSSCTRSVWVATHWTTSALTQTQLQGNSNYLGGFALDPLTYATVNGLDHTNTGIYNPSYHPNKLDGVSLVNFQNQASGASTSAELTTHSHFRLPENHRTVPDFTAFADGYPGDS